MKKFIYITLTILLGLFATACKTKLVYVPVEKETIKTEYIDQYMRDSIHVLDSIFIFFKGDTVFKEKYKTIYKEKIVKDSIFYRDSILVQVPYPVIEVKETNQLKNWQIILMVLGGATVGYVGLRVWRKIKI